MNSTIYMENQATAEVSKNFDKMIARLGIEHRSVWWLVYAVICCVFMDGWTDLDSEKRILYTIFRRFPRLAYVLVAVLAMHASTLVGPHLRRYMYHYTWEYYSSVVVFYSCFIFALYLFFAFVPGKLAWFTCFCLNVYIHIVCPLAIPLVWATEACFLLNRVLSAVFGFVSVKAKVWKTQSRLLTRVMDRFVLRIVKRVERVLITLICCLLAPDYTTVLTHLTTYVYDALDKSFILMFMGFETRADALQDNLGEVYDTWEKFKVSKLGSHLNNIVCCLYCYGFMPQNVKPGVMKVISSSFVNQSREAMLASKTGPEYFCKNLYTVCTTLYDAYLTGNVHQLLAKEETLITIDQEFSVLKGIRSSVMSRGFRAIDPSLGVGSMSMFVRRCEALIEMIDKRLKIEGYPAVQKSLFHHRSELIEMILEVQQFQSNQSMQVSPLVVTMIGGSHCGKSGAALELIGTMLNAMGIPRTEGDVWNVPTMSQYDDKLDHGHTAFIYDDACNSTDREVQLQFSKRLISIVNNVRSMAVCAELEKKGEISLSFDCGVVTSNVSFDTLSAGSNSRASQANRFGIMIEVEVKPEYRLSNGTDWERINQEGMLMSDHLQAYVYTKKIRKRPNMQEKVAFVRSENPISWREVLVMVGEKAVIHRRQQETLLSKLNKKSKMQFCKHHIFKDVCDICKHEVAPEVCSSISSSYTVDSVLGDVPPEVITGSVVIEDPPEVLSAEANSLEYVTDAAEHIYTPLIREISATLRTMRATAISVCISLCLCTVWWFFTGGLVSCFIALFGFWYVLRKFMRKHFSKHYDKLQYSYNGSLESVLRSERGSRAPSIGSLVAVVAVGYIISTWLRKVKPLSDLRADSFEPEGAKRPVATEQEKEKYEKLPDQWKSIMNVVGMSTSSSNAVVDQIVGVLAKSSLVRVHFVHPEQRGICCIAVGVKGNFALMVGHSLEYMLAEWPDSKVEYEVEHVTNRIGAPSIMTGVLDLKKEIVKIPGKDMYVVYLSNMNPRRDIMKHLPLAPTTSYSSGKIVTIHNMDKNKYEHHTEVSNFTRIGERDVEITYKGRDIFIKRSTLYNSDMETGKGECMAPLVCRTSNPLICGFHVATRPTGEYCMQQVLLGEVQDAISRFDNLFFANSGEPVTNTLDEMNECLGTEVAIVNAVHEKHAINGITFAHSGIFVGAHNQGGYRMKSHVRRFPEADKMMEAFGIDDTYGPAQGMRDYSTFNVNLTKILSVPAPVSPEVHGKAIADLRDYYDHWLEAAESALKEFGHPVDLLTACSGVDGISHFKAVNVKSSAGFPLNKAKENFIEFEYVDGKPYSLEREPYEQIQRLVKSYVRRLAEGKRINVIVRMKTKDEPTLQLKDGAPNMKVRPYYVEEFAFGLVCSMYLSGISRALYSCGFKSHYPHGINCSSREWQNLRDSLAEFSDTRIMNGDFSRFDMSYSPQVTQVFAEFYLKAAKLSGHHSELNLRVIQGIFTEIMYPLVEYNGILIFCNSLNPSGNKLTVDINCNANAYFHRYGYYKAMGLSAPPFDSQVRAYFYGDDCIASVKSESTKFNQKTMYTNMKAIGVSYTDAFKQQPSKAYVALEGEAEFLKRPFVHAWWDKERIVGPLDPASFNKLLYYVRHKNDVPQEKVLAASLGSYLREVYTHSEPRFIHDRIAAMEILKERDADDLEYELPTKEDMRDYWEANAVEDEVVGETAKDERSDTIVDVTELNSTQATYDSISSVCGRKVLCLATTLTSSTALSGFAPLSLLLSNQVIREKTENFALARFTIKISVKVTGSASVSGRYLVRWRPLGTNDLSNAPGAFLQASVTDHRFMVAMWNLPGVQIDPSVSSNHEFTIPFTWFHRHLSITDAAAPQAYGHVYIMPLVPIASTSSQPPTVNLRVFAEFETIDLFGATQARFTVDPEPPMTNGVIQQNPEPATEEANVFNRNGTRFLRAEANAVDADDRPISDTLSAVSNVSRWFGERGIFSAVMGPMHIVAKLGSELARHMGYGKPLDANPTQKYVPMGTNCITNVDGTTDHQNLGIYQRGEQQCVTAAKFGVDPADHMDFAHTLERPGIIGVFPISPDLDNPNIVWGHPVSPCTWVVEDGVISTDAATQYICAFTYWRATICYTFEIVKNPFQRGILRVDYDPRQDNPSTNVYNQNYVRYIDIDEVNDFTLEIEWQSDQDWLHVEDVPSGDNSSTVGAERGVLYSNRYHNGYIQLSVFSRITHIGDTPAPVSVIVTKRLKDVHVLRPTSRQLASWSYRPVPPGALSVGSFMANAVDSRRNDRVYDLTFQEKRRRQPYLRFEVTFLICAFIFLFLAYNIVDCIFEWIVRIFTYICSLGSEHAKRLYDRARRPEENSMLSATANAVESDMSKSVTDVIPGIHVEHRSFYSEYCAEPLSSFRPLLKREYLDTVLDLGREKGIFIPAYPDWRGEERRSDGNVVSVGPAVHRSITSIFDVLRSMHLCLSGSARMRIAFVPHLTVNTTSEFIAKVDLIPHQLLEYSLSDYGGTGNSRTGIDHIDDLPSGLSGSALVATAVNPIIPVSIPGYAPRRWWNSSRLGNHPDQGGVSVTILASDQNHPTAVNNQVDLYLMRSWGDDINLGMFLFPRPFVKYKFPS